jgi:hypothetical protein
MNPLNIAQSRVANKQPNQVALQTGLVGVRRLLGVLYGVNLTAGTTDIPIALNLVPEAAAGAANYMVRGVQVNNASVSLSSATLGLYSAAAAGGDNLVVVAALSALTAATKNLDMTLAAVAGTTVRNENTLYFRTGTGQAATCDLYIWGEVLP